MTLTELSIKRPSTIVILFSALGLLGFFSFQQLKYELLPKFNPPVVSILGVYPGAGPEEIENTVGKVLEDAVSGIENVSSIYISSGEGVCFVNIELNQSADVSASLQEVERQIAQIRNLLPSGMEPPRVFKISLDEIPVLRIGATSKMPGMDFYDLVNNQIKPYIASTPGVGRVVMIGGERREIQVSINRDKLQLYKLSLTQVVQILRASNLDFPTGAVKNETEQYVVRISGKIKTVDELRNLVIAKVPRFGEIRVSDIATVKDDQAEFSQTNRINGKTSIGINISKQSDANAVEVSRLVRARLKELEKRFEMYSVKFEIGQDGSVFTLDAANAVKFDLYFAIFLVAITMVLFLHSIRNAFIVMISIPTSILTTFIVMYVAGFSLNLMTLLAYSLVIGILVDDSIVVLENIYRFLEEGHSKRDAALRGRNDIGFTAISITMVDVVVFVPLSLVSGLIGGIMREFAIVMVFSTLISLLVSFTITPALASRISHLEKGDRDTWWTKFIKGFERQYELLVLRYEKLLRYALSRKKMVAFITIAMLVASFGLIAGGFIQFEFITVSDRGEFSVFINTETNTTATETNKTTRRVENIINEFHEVMRISTSVGTVSEGLIASNGTNIAEIAVTLVPKNERSRSTDDIMLEIKKKLSKVPGIKYKASPIGIFGTANQTPIQFHVTHTDRDSAIKASIAVVDVLRKIPGSADVRSSAESDRPELRVEIDRTKLADLGLTSFEVGSAMRIAFTGDDQSKYRVKGEEYIIRIILDQFNRRKIEDVENLGFTNSRGETILLKQFANVYQSIGPAGVIRFSRKSAITISSQVSQGVTSGSVGSAFKEKIKEVKLPLGTEIAYIGDLKNQSDALTNMLTSIFAAIIFIYMVMVLLYDSYLYPLVVLFTIPLSVIGAFFALALSGASLNIFSALGLIVLIGLVGKNAILLVDFANKLKETHSHYEAVIEAGKLRLRPILMTTIAMVLGVMPIAITSGAGSEWKQGLAWVIIGGLISSTFLTLIVIPIFFLKFDEWKKQMNK